MEDFLYEIWDVLVAMGVIVAFIIVWIYWESARKDDDQ